MERSTIPRGIGALFLLGEMLWPGSGTCAHLGLASLPIQHATSSLSTRFAIPPPHGLLHLSLSFSSLALTDTCCVAFPLVTCQLTLSRASLLYHVPAHRGSLLRRVVTLHV
eukprot:3329121-Rhodomonas_salina.1